MSDEQLAILERVVVNYPPHWTEETAALQAALEEIRHNREVDLPEFVLLETRGE